MVDRRAQYPKAFVPIKRRELSPTTTNVYQVGAAGLVFVPGSLIGYYSGYPNQIFKTTDGGETWTGWKIDIPKTLYIYSFPTEQIGYGISYIIESPATYRIVKTTDGGQSWHDTSTVNTTGGHIIMANINEGALVGTTIYYTTDGWATSATATGSPGGSPAVVYKLSNDTFLMGNYQDEIWRSTDNGQTWAEITHGLGASDVYDFGEKPNGEVFVAMEGGIIGKSTDSGATWANSYGPNVGFDGFTGIAWVDNDIGVAAYADRGVSAATFSYTTDGGDNWTEGNLPHPYYTPAQAYRVGSSVVFNAVDQLLKTTDGQTWTELENWNVFFNDVHFNGNVGLGTAYNNTLFLTQDRGKTWSTIHPRDAHNNLYGAYVLDSNTLFFGVSGGEIYKSTDSGATWTEKHDMDAYVYGFGFYDANNGIAYGTGGKIARTTDGGENWTTISVGEALHIFYQVHYFDADNVMVIGGLALSPPGIEPASYYSEDGGATWSSSTLPENSDVGRLYAASVINGVQAIAITDTKGVVFGTGNKGKTFTKLGQLDAHFQAMNFVSYGSVALQMTDERRGWAVLCGPASNLTPHFYYTVDGGYHWDEFPGEDAAVINTYCVMDSSTLFLANRDYSAHFKAEST